MDLKARTAAVLPVWALVGTAWLAATVTFAAVHGSRIGCIDTGVADFAAVTGVAGLGFAAASLLLVAAVPLYRSGFRAAAALAPLGLSVYAIVALLARDGANCV